MVLAVSAWTYHRILKISRTIVEMESAPDIASAHASEAMQYITPARRMK